MALSDSGFFDRLSHAYIVSAPTQEECLLMARRLAAAAVCSGEQRPCGQCRHCRKAENGIHPDISLIQRLEDDKGKLRNSLLVSQTRALAVDAYVLPNEAAGKAYIIQDADTMTPEAQNAALKLFEEPPRGVVFILCVTNPAAMLPTVRSRCVELSAGRREEGTDSQAAKLAEGFMKALSSGRESELFRWCAKNEGIEQRRCRDFIGALEGLTVDMISGRTDSMGISSSQLIELTGLLSRCAEYGRFNVSTKHIFGLLAALAPVKAETEDK